MSTLAETTAPDEVAASALSLRKRLLFTVAVGLAALLIVELTLRLLGVVFYPHAITLADGADREPTEVAMIPDGQVQWVLAPGAQPGTPLAINTHGMRGPEIAVGKASGVTRILCLGDSCTFGARSERPYPRVIEDLIRSRTSYHVEVLNGAVPGHAAHQGTAMLDRYLKFSPDIVTVYFGWNDHWRRTESLSGPTLPAPPFTDRLLILRGLRLAWASWNAKRAVLAEGDVVDMKDTDLRLPPTHYWAMLDEFAVMAKKHGFALVYVTAPSALNRENLSWIVERRGWARRPEDVVALHARYNRMSRDMALTKHAPLLDLDRIFREDGRALLYADGIHLSQTAHDLAAERLFDLILPILDRKEK